ncbi:hypothetical protein [Actinomadura sp. 6N118]|uniref:hypothetical protein n=1 Tax=Actinomadura sp. 6N118 TaxID=3375151 RepID=UPI00378AB6F2
MCEVDHVDGWALGNSPTHLDKLALCCGWHNRWKHTHPEQIHITHTEDGRYRYRALPPDGVARSRHGRPVDQADNPWHDHAA